MTQPHTQAPKTDAPPADGMSLTTGPEAVARLLADAAGRHPASRVTGPAAPSATAATASDALSRAYLMSADASGGWIETALYDRTMLHRWITGGTRVNFALRDSETDVLFTTTLQAHDANHRLADGSSGDAVQFALPTQVASSSRRRSLRVPVNVDSDVSVRIWRINEHVLLRDRVMPSQELKCELRDLSLGGLRVVVRPRGEESLRLEQGQRFRIELRAGKGDMVFEGRLRYPQSTGRDDVYAVCGVEFTHVDRDIDSRRHYQRLQLVLAELQRVAANRGAAA